MSNKRFAALVIDLIITAAISNIPFFYFVISNIGQNADNPQNQFIEALASSMIALLYMVFRDLPQKGSIGKRILKLEIIDSKTKEKATTKQRLVRNLFWLLGGLEILVYIFRKERIGDTVAHTTVIEKAE
ncbi:RDD family protein [Fibrobacter sp.]|uniref:RDD family protein n=1 Tax=Fibrobacter sp. TaxID=35828 RepID=UPI00388E65DD